MAFRLTLFTVFASLVAFSAHLFFGSVIFAAAEQDTFAITLRDVYENETHDLSGIIMAPSACHDISVRAKDVDAGMTAIVFETWEQPYRETCEKSPAPRAIHVLAFGPKDLELRGLLDGEWIPLSIVRE
jgi:hypothetical protein